MSQEKLICGISGKEFQEGDLVLPQVIQPENESQLPYTRYVKAELVLNEEELEVAQKEGKVFAFETK